MTFPASYGVDDIGPAVGDSLVKLTLQAGSMAALIIVAILVAVIMKRRRR
jgi:hypothetical protein